MKRNALPALVLILTLSFVYTAQCQQAGTPPIYSTSLKHFGAQWKNTTVELNWQVADENKIDSYALDRSIHGRTWLELTKKIALNTAGNRQYNYTDAAPTAGVNWYQLRVFEKGSLLSRHLIIALPPITNTAAQLSCNPFPVRKNIIQFIASLPAGEYQLKVADSASGAAVLSTVYKHSGGTVFHTLARPKTMKGGAYRLTLGNSKIQVSTFFFNLAHFDFITSYYWRFKDNAGCSNNEITQLETKYKVRLPAAYKEFLHLFGKNTDGLLDGYHTTIDQIKRKGESVKADLADASPGKTFKLLPDMFFFADWQGTVMYFRCNGNDDPPVYMIHALDDVEQYSKSFTDFIRKEGLGARQ